MKQMIRWLLLTLLPVAMGACGPEVVGGGQHGTVRTTMNDDPEGSGASQFRAAGPVFNLAGAGSVTEQVVQLDGSVAAVVAAELITPAGGSIDLTGGPVLRTVSIGSSTPVTVGRDDRIDVGVYPGVRLSFTRVEVSLAAGGRLPLEVEVGIGAEPLVVEVPLEVVVREREVTRVHVDLNAAVWLALADPLTGLVTPAAFASAIAVSTHAEQAN